MICLCDDGAAVAQRADAPPPAASVAAAPRVAGGQPPQAASRAVPPPSAVAMFLVLLLIARSVRADEITPTGFHIDPVADGLNQPIALAFAPDGRLFIAEKGGTIRVVQDGALLPQPFAVLAVHDFLEGGLLGLAVDPAFAQNHFLYGFATVSPEEQQIIRLTERAGVGEDLTVIRSHLPSRGTFHNGGCLKFGPDGKLYFSIGDNTVRENGQDMSTLAGKICRINADGSTPDDNPFVTPTGTPRAIFALGFRNPFRFCFAPDGRLFANDVGSDFVQRREEINLVRAGQNHGWPVTEGYFDSASFPQLTNPIYAYHDKGTAPAGAVYYTGGQFPIELHGNLFHLEYTLNRLYRVVLDGDAVVSHELFAQLEGSPVDLVQGPDGCLYFCELACGRVRRICYDGPLDSPVVVPPLPTPAGLCGIGLAIPAMMALWLSHCFGLPDLRPNKRP